MEKYRTRHSIIDPGQKILFFIGNSPPTNIETLKTLLHSIGRLMIKSQNGGRLVSHSS